MFVSKRTANEFTQWEVKLKLAYEKINKRKEAKVMLRFVVQSWTHHSNLIETQPKSIIAINPWFKN